LIDLTQPIIPCDVLGADEGDSRCSESEKGESPGF